MCYFTLEVAFNFENVALGRNPKQMPAKPNQTRPDKFTFSMENVGKIVWDLETRMKINAVEWSLFEKYPIDHFISYIYLFFQLTSTSDNFILSDKIFYFLFFL